MLLPAEAFPLRLRALAAIAGQSFQACLCCCWHSDLLLLLSDASILKCVDATQAPGAPLTFRMEFKLSRGDYGFNMETCWECAVRIFERDVGIDRIVVDQAAMCFMFACVRD